MLKKVHSSIAILFLCGIVNTGMASEVSLFTATLQGQIPIKTWKDLRDEQIVKQDLDYSCGAASVATIMNGFYGLDVTEAELLDRMEADGAASFQDLAEVVQAYGLKGMGIALNFEQLHQLKVPAIAYLKYRDDDHFSVIRSVNSDGSVSLGDPSWGNRRFTQQQFLEMWETRGNENLKGKVLLLLPDGIDVTTMNRSFFGLTETNTLSEAMLILRY